MVAGYYEQCGRALKMETEYCLEIFVTTDPYQTTCGDKHGMWYNS
jgi:hypothetical protein